MNTARRILHLFSSMKLTLVCLALMMVLIFAGTLDQVYLGTYFAQKKYFDVFWVRDFWFFGARLPFFPGGLLVGGLWAVNLIAAHGTRLAWNRKKAGILLIHFGLLVLVLGQFLTQMLAYESQLSVEEGQSKSYSESPRRVELAFIDTQAADYDQVTVIPAALLQDGARLEKETLPFAVKVRDYEPNARLAMLEPGAAPVANQGVGMRVAYKPAAISTVDDEPNNPATVIELERSGQSLGVWLLSLGLGAPQSVTVDGHVFQISLRPERKYNDFTLTLKDFKHDIYLGTDVPKNYSSLVHLEDSRFKESRDVLIYMNNPLRYDGKTFYQASFGKNDTLSVLQVVENPVWLTPYISSLLVVLGLLLQFGMHLRSFLKKERR